MTCIPGDVKLNESLTLRNSPSCISVDKNFACLSKKHLNRYDKSEFFFFHLFGNCSRHTKADRTIHTSQSEDVFNSETFVTFPAAKLRENRGKEYTNMTILTDNIVKQEESDTVREE